MIEYRDIKKSYRDKVVINHFDLKIESGDFVCIVGSSGSGKTTILKMVNGLVECDNGEVLIDDININSMDMIKHRRNVGYSMQGSVLFPHLTVKENITYVADLCKDSTYDNEDVITWLNDVGLDESYLNVYPSELSGGQQQRVGIARALFNKPNILLMDEPFGAVDAITRSGLQKLIKEIHTKFNITVLFVTHDIKEALALSTKVLVMSEGKIEQFDNVDNILNNPSSDFVRALVKESI